MGKQPLCCCFKRFHAHKHAVYEFIGTESCMLLLKVGNNGLSPLSISTSWPDELGIFPDVGHSNLSANIGNVDFRRSVRLEPDQPWKQIADLVHNPSVAVDVREQDHSSVHTSNARSFAVWALTSTRSCYGRRVPNEFRARFSGWNAF